MTTGQKLRLIRMASYACPYIAGVCAGMWIRDPSNIPLGFFHCMWFLLYCVLEIALKAETPS